MTIEQTLNLVRPEIREMVPYEAIESNLTEHEYNKRIWINANENPYAPYPPEDNKGFNRYPTHQAIRLRSLLAGLYNVNTEEILVTRGSDEAIDVITRTFLRYNIDSIIVCPPTFGMYQVYADIQGCKTIKVPLLEEKGYQLNTEEIIKSAKSNSCKAVFIPCPNAPMGHLMNTEDITKLCEELSGTSLIVIDEAYLEFSKTESLTKYLNKYSNLIILKTLSKAYAMAGLRIGCCMTHPAVIRILEAVQSPYSIAVPSLNTAIKALSPEGLKIAITILDKILDQKIVLENELKKFSFITKIFPSSANFILFQVKDAERFINYCEQNDIIIRCQTSQIPNAVRISVGTDEENQLFISKLNDFS